MWNIAVRLLREAIKQVPAVRWAFGLVGVAAAVFLVIGLLGGTHVAFTGPLTMFGGMVLLILISQIPILGPLLRWPILVLVWGVVVLSLLVGSAAVSAWAFGVPVRLARTINSPVIDQRPSVACALPELLAPVNVHDEILRIPDHLQLVASIPQADIGNARSYPHLNTDDVATFARGIIAPVVEVRRGLPIYVSQAQSALRDTSDLARTMERTGTPPDAISGDYRMWRELLRVRCNNLSTTLRIYEAHLHWIERNQPTVTRAEVSQACSQTKQLIETLANSIVDDDDSQFRAPNLGRAYAPDIRDTLRGSFSFLNSPSSALTPMTDKSPVNLG